MTPKLCAVCSVCFATHDLNTAKGKTNNPIRHGFQIVGGHGQGHEGGWHTGPCQGVNFAHFGASTEGTRWALEQIKGQIAQAVDTLARLDTKPELRWSFQPRTYDKTVWKYVPDADVKISRTLALGTAAEKIEFQQAAYNQPQYVTAPSYDQELASRVAEVLQRKVSLQVTRKRYEDAIANWKPADAVLAAPKAEIVHRSVMRGTRGYAVPACQLAMPSYKAARVKMTADLEAVTCKRCGVTAK